MNAPNATPDMAEIHWLTTMLQNIDVGLVVLDRDWRVALWNGFMENHSGLTSSKAKGEELFSLFPDLPARWLRRKLESVALLRVTAFTVWEQRPYVFRFKNHRSITGTTEHMYQNLSIVPLAGVNGEVGHVCLIVYDVTDAAVGREALVDANAELERMSQTDALSGIACRGFWERSVEAEFRRCRRTGGGAALVMIDIDHFKRVNDEHGHQAGDAVIKAVAAALRACARATDCVGRYGGEEFGVVLIDADGAGASYFAERARKAMERLVVEHGGRALEFTVSVGVAELTDDLPGHDAWIGRADAALYESKAAGRNCSKVYGARAT